MQRKQSFSLFMAYPSALEMGRQVSKNRLQFWHIELYCGIFPSSGHLVMVSTPSYNEFSWLSTRASTPFGYRNKAF